nr:MAG TPA: hypothetical protein [Caudoviricetes sp.]
MISNFLTFYLVNTGLSLVTIYHSQTFFTSELFSIGILEPIASSLL